METDALKSIESLCGKGAVFERELLRSKRLFASVRQGIKMSEMLQVVCPGTGRLDEAMTVVPLQDLTEFRERPIYRRICFTFVEGAHLERILIPCFQYCRLLLVSGGRLALLFPDDGRGGGWYNALSAFVPVSRYGARRSYPADLLRSAGFNDVQLVVCAGEGRIILGSRPNSPWRDKR